MNIFSKQMLMNSKKKYKAYLVNYSNVYDVADLGFTEDIDPKTTKGATIAISDAGMGVGAFIILNGKLYNTQSSGGSLIRIGTDEGWEVVSNIRSSSLTPTKYGFAIRNKYLYCIEGDTASKLKIADSSEGWTDVCGVYMKKGSYTVGACAIGIKDGSLYYTSDEDSLTSLETTKTWTKLTGYCGAYANGSSSVQAPNFYMYALTNNGYLYALHKSSSSKPVIDVVGGGSNYIWTDVSGTSRNTSGGSEYAVGICNGALYQIQNTTYTSLNSSMTWTKVCSSMYVSSTATAQRYAYGIADGKLYKIYNSGITQVGTSNKWTDVVGSYVAGSTNAKFVCGIEDNKLYRITDTTATLIPNLKPVKIYGDAYGQYSKYLVVCEQ